MEDVFSSSGSYCLGEPSLPNNDFVIPQADYVSITAESCPRCVGHCLILLFVCYVLQGLAASGYYPIASIDAVGMVYSFRAGKRIRAALVTWKKSLIPMECLEAPNLSPLAIDDELHIYDSDGDRYEWADDPVTVAQLNWARDQARLSSQYIVECAFCGRIFTEVAERESHERDMCIRPGAPNHIHDEECDSDHCSSFDWASYASSNID